MSSQASLKGGDKTGSESERDLQSAGCEDGEMRPQAKACGQPREAGKGKKRTSRRSVILRYLHFSRDNSFRILPLRAVR